MKRATVYATIVLAWMFCAGCDIFNSGPRIVESTLAVVKPMAVTLVSKMDPKAITAHADGRVTNPEFKLNGVVGVGTYFDMSVQMVGGEAGFAVAAAGPGREGGVDQDVVDIQREFGKLSPSDWERLLDRVIELKKASGNVGAEPVSEPLPADEPLLGEPSEPVSLGDPAVHANEPMAAHEEQRPWFMRRPLRARYT